MSKCLYLFWFHDAEEWMSWAHLRFLSDSNVPGVEKLAVCGRFGESASDKRIWSLTSSSLGAATDLAPPMCVFNIKGWSRTLAAVAILRCAYENEEFMKASIMPFMLPHIFSLECLVYSCFVNFAGRPSQRLWLSLVLMTKSINTLVWTTVMTSRSKTHLLAKPSTCHTRQGPWGRFMRHAGWHQARKK